MMQSYWVVVGRSGQPWADPFWRKEMAEARAAMYDRQYKGDAPFRVVEYVPKDGE